jgi:hypothetical protein
MGVEGGRVILELPQEGLLEIPLDGIRKARLLEE